MTKESRKIFTYQILEKIDSKRDEIIENLQIYIIELYFLSRGGNVSYFKEFVNTFDDHNGLAEYFQKLKIINQILFILPIFNRCVDPEKEELNENEREVLTRINQLKSNGCWRIVDQIVKFNRSLNRSVVGTHRINLLKEMSLLSKDFMREHELKLFTTKIIAREVNRQFVKKLKEQYNSTNYDSAFARSYCSIVSCAIKRFWASALSWKYLEIYHKNLNYDLNFLKDKFFQSIKSMKKTKSTQFIFSDESDIDVDEENGHELLESFKKEKFTDGRKRKKGAELTERCLLNNKAINNFDELQHTAEGLFPQNLTKDPKFDYNSTLFHHAELLRNYQKVGVKWLVDTYANNINCNLADDKGLGKSVEIIAFMCYIYEFSFPCKPNLLIVDKNKIFKWKSEFKQWAPGLSVNGYYGPTFQLDSMITDYKNSSQDILITSYDYVKDNNYLKNHPWLIIIMESKLKHLSRKKLDILLNLKSKHRILLTNSELKEFPHLLNVFDYLFQDYSDFPSIEDILFRNMDNDVFDKEQIISNLKKSLNGFVLGRKISDISNQLPKISQLQICCSIAQRQEFLYNGYLKELSLSYTQSRGSNISSQHKSIISKIFRLFSHPSIPEARVSQSPFVCQNITYPIIQKFNIDIDHIPSSLLFISAEFDNFYDSAFKIRLLSRKNFGIFVKKIVKLFKWDGIITLNTDFLRSAKLCKCSYSCNCKVYIKKFAESYISKLSYIKSKKIMERAVKKSLLMFFCRNFVNISNFSVNPVLGPRLIRFLTFPSSVFVLNLRETFKFLSTSFDVYRNFELVVKNVVSYEQFRQPARISHDIIGPKLLILPKRQDLLDDCEKLKLLDKILFSNCQKGLKTLIFTNYIEMMEIFRNYFTYRNFHYLLLDQISSYEERFLASEKFNNDPNVFILVMTSSTNWTFMNLTKVDMVVHYDRDWCIDRREFINHQVARLRLVRDISVITLIPKGGLYEAFSHYNLSISGNSSLKETLNGGSHSKAATGTNILNTLLVESIKDSISVLNLHNMDEGSISSCCNIVDPRIKIGEMAKKFSSPIVSFAMRQLEMATSVSHAETEAELAEVMNDSMKKDLENWKVEQPKFAEIRDLESQGMKIDESTKFYDFLARSQNNQV